MIYAIQRILFFCLLLVSTIVLGYTVTVLSTLYPIINTLAILSSLSFLQGYVLLGWGIGLPLILIATIFGWIQFWLLVAGHIDPHLSREGFFTVLRRIFKTI